MSARCSESKTDLYINIQYIYIIIYIYILRHPRPYHLDRAGSQKVDFALCSRVSPRNRNAVCFSSESSQSVAQVRGATYKV